MHNSRLLFALIIIGLLLIVPLGWYLLSVRVRPADTDVALRNLAELPALELRRRHGANLSLNIPDDPAWKRIRHDWGDPSFEVALVSSQGECQYCLDGINVAAQQHGQSLTLENAGWIYGFSSADSFAVQCKSVGQSFHAAPGSNVDLSLTTSGEFADGTMLIVRPVWPYTKDKLVGVDLDKDILPIVIGMAVFGLLVALGASFALRTGKRETTPVSYHRNAQP